MTELQHLQRVILIIAKYVDDLCKKNDIQYFLLGGSAIGAIRHKGYIPWDDDLDIVMDNKNYDKFVKVCREQLDTEKYYFQEGYVDWPMPFSKIKLRGTVLEEPGAYTNKENERGIYLDVFKMENCPSSSIGQRWQYFCAKYLLCYCLLERGWDEVTGIKKMMMLAAFPVKIGFIRKFLRKQVEKWNGKDTKYCGLFSGRYRYAKSFYKKELFAQSIYVPFEDIELPVAVGYDKLLTQIFGDYMTPPPAREQVGLHLRGVDFGEY